MLVHNITVESGDSWQKHVEWASVSDAGGTNFDSALNYTIATIEQFKSEGVSGADILFITDGECGVSDDTVMALNKLKEEVGTRLIVVMIGGGYWYGGRYSHYTGIETLADMIIKVGYADFVNNAENVVAQITEQIVKAEFD